MDAIADSVSVYRNLKAPKINEIPWFIIISHNSPFCNDKNCCNSHKELHVFLLVVHCDWNLLSAWLQLVNFQNSKAVVLNTKGRI